MGGHVLGVSRRRGDLGIEASGLQAFVSDGWVIVEVDQVVRDAWMLGLAREDRLQDRRALELVGVGLIGGRSRGIWCQRVVDLRLVVVWITLRQLFHGLGVGHDAGAVVDALIVGIHDPERRQVIALALGLGADAPCFGQRRRTLGQILRRRGNVGIEQKAERDTPIGDGAFGIGLQGLLECPL